MRIDRGLRTAISAVYPAGYRAPTPVKFNTEQGRICVSSQGKMAPEDRQNLPFPEILVLTARLNPQRITEPMRIHLITDKDRWPPLMLYGTRTEKFAHRSVQLLYQGLGKVQWHNGGSESSFRGYYLNALKLAFLDDADVIFEKTFLQQPTELLVRKEKLLDGQIRVTPPGNTNCYPLWAYGGFFEPGCSLKAIEQGVFTLTSRQSATVASSPLSFWRDKTTALSGETIYFLSDFKPKHWRTLAGDIETGQVRVDLCYGVDERGETCRQIYRSFRFIQHDPTHGILEVFFTKEEN